MLGSHVIGDFLHGPFLIKAEIDTSSLYSSHSDIWVTLHCVMQPTNKVQWEGQTPDWRQRIPN